MAYKIEYGTVLKRRKTKKRPNFRQHAMTAGCFLLFVLVAHLFWPDRLAALRTLLLPQTGAVMALVDDLQSGDSLPQAIEAFCQQVMGYGQ